MPKDAPWFKHDADATSDPDIEALLAKYHAEGYGWYWMLVERMRMQEGFKLPLCRVEASALRMHGKPAKLTAFVNDCIDVFGLFKSDGTYFWSERLLRDMRVKEEKSEQARTAALAMHEKRQSCERIADAEQTQSDRFAIRREEKRIEENQDKDTFPPVVSKDTTSPQVGETAPQKTRTPFRPPTVEEVAAYCRERCNSVVAQQWHDFYTSKGWMVGKSPMKDWKAAVRTWERSGYNNREGQQTGGAFQGMRRYEDNED